MLMQSWPLLAQMPRTAPRTVAPSRAPGSTSSGFLPPSSMEQSLS